MTTDQVKQSLATQYQKALNNFFAWDEKKTLKFLSAVGYCVQSTPKLLECSEQSLMWSFMKCAEYNLFPSSVSGEVYILPYGWIAQFQLGYKGIISLLYRAGIGSIYTDIVRANDRFKVTSGLNPNIEHEYALENRWDPIWVYVVCSVNNEKIWKYMWRDEVLAFKKFSKSAWSTSSPWDPKNDPELNMWRKTVIKQVAKNLSLTEDVYSAIAEDNKDWDIEEYQKRSLVENMTRPSTNLEDLFNNPPQTIETLPDNQ